MLATGTALNSITVSPISLSSALESISKIATGKDSFPKGFLFDLDNQIIITRSWDHQMQISIPGVVEGIGKYWVGVEFKKSIKTIKATTLPLTFSESICKISSLGCDFEFPLLETEHIFEPIVEGENPIMLTGDSFRTLSKVCPFVADGFIIQKITQQVLNGVHIETRNDAIEVAATNGHFLAVDRIESNENFPSTVINPLFLSLGGSKKAESVQLSFVKDRVYSVENPEKFHEIPYIVSKNPDGMMMKSRTIEGQYPNYEQLIPRQFKINFTANVSELLSAVKTISTQSLNDVVILRCTADVISVETTGEIVSKMTVKASLYGEDNFDIAFKGRYLQTSLKAFSGSSAKFECNSNKSACVITSSSDLKILLMPVQIRN
jgi:DNA polymerase III sliding clamp (beta) subunit (PCNA family)